jgi:hypothetical protein
MAPSPYQGSEYVIASPIHPQAKGTPSIVHGLLEIIDFFSRHFREKSAAPEFSSSPHRTRWIVQRGGGLSNLESRQALDQVIETGRCGVFLSLTGELYAKLRTR